MILLLFLLALFPFTAKESDTSSPFHSWYMILLLLLPFTAGTWYSSSSSSPFHSWYVILLLFLLLLVLFPFTAGTWYFSISQLRHNTPPPPSLTSSLLFDSWYMILLLLHLALFPFKTGTSSSSQFSSLFAAGAWSFSSKWFLIRSSNIFGRS